ncbi:MAG: ATP synthase F1 subunit epsilon [bacterium]|nr:ATP synthase F1 subunit epsilon [bacterium]
MATSPGIINVSVVIPERTVFSGEATYVSLPGQEGVLGILPGHTRLVLALEIGELVIKTVEGVRKIALGGGFALVEGDRVSVMAKVAELAEEIDVRRAEEAKLRAEDALARQVSGVNFVGLEAALHRAITRIRVANHD